MAITVACSLNIYAANLTSKYSSLYLSDLSTFDYLSGLVELRLRSRYQLVVQADSENGELQIPLDDILSPEICSCFVIPRAFLFQEEIRESYVEKTLLDLELGLDDKASKFLAPKIAELAVEVAERRELGFATVAEVLIEKADFIYKEELSKIATDINAQSGTCVNVNDPNSFSGVSEINDLSLPF